MIPCFHDEKEVYPLLTVSQASEDAARYPVAAKVAELLVQDLVSLVFCFYVLLNYKIAILKQFSRIASWSAPYYMLTKLPSKTIFLIALQSGA